MPSDTEKKNEVLRLKNCRIIAPAHQVPTGSEEVVAFNGRCYYSRARNIAPPKAVRHNQQQFFLGRSVFIFLI